MSDGCLVTNIFFFSRSRALSSFIHTSLSKYHFLLYSYFYQFKTGLFTILFCAAAASRLRKTTVLFNVDALELDSHFEHSYRCNTYLYNDLHNKSVPSIVVSRSRKMRERSRRVGPATIVKIVKRVPRNNRRTNGTAISGNR